MSALHVAAREVIAMYAVVEIGDQKMPCNSPGLAAWIESQVRRRRADGAPTCLVVAIPDLDLRLGVGDCGPGGGVATPTREKQALIELWERHVRSHPLNAGLVVSFLREIGCRVAA